MLLIKNDSRFKFLGHLCTHSTQKLHNMEQVSMYQVNDLLISAYIHTKLESPTVALLERGVLTIGLKI